MSPKSCASVFVLGLASLALAARAAGGAGGAAGRSQAAVASYAGVSPEAGEPPPQPRPPGGAELITWPGYRLRGPQGEEVFLQLTGAVPYSSRVRGKVVEVTLSRVKVALRNNLRRVVTGQFGGAVASFKLQAQPGQRVRLEIRLARALTPTITSEQRAPYTFLRVAFPAP